MLTCLSPSPLTADEALHLERSSRRRPTIAQLRVPDILAVFHLNVEAPPTFDGVQQDPNALWLRVVGSSRPKRIPNRIDVDGMTASELSEGMRMCRVDIPTLASYLGCPPEKIQHWLGDSGGDKQGQAPPYVRMVLALLTLNGARRLADAVVTATSTPRQRATEAVG